MSPNFSVLERIEQRFTVLDFLDEVRKSNTKLSNVAWVLFCAISESGEKLVYSDFGEVVMEHRTDAILAATDIAIAMMTAGPEKESKKK